MPRFITESGVQTPLDGVTYNYQSGVMSIPSGESFGDLEVRVIADTASFLSSEIQYSPASGVLGVLTGTSGWITLALS